MTYSIIAEGLAKRFGDTVALDGVDLAATTGSVLGLLGPNGAGKTTAVRRFCPVRGAGVITSVRDGGPGPRGLHAFRDSGRAARH